LSFKQVKEGAMECFTTLSSPVPCPPLAVGINIERIQEHGARVEAADNDYVEQVTQQASVGSIAAEELPGHAAFDVEEGSRGFTGIHP
jgi:hypothetical protein